MAAVKGYKGAAAAVVLGTGYATPLVPANSTHRFIGAWGETYDNSAGSAGGYWTGINRDNCMKFSQTGTTITAAYIGYAAYFSDDQTITLTSGTTWAGTIAAVDADGGVWVDVRHSLLQSSSQGVYPTPLTDTVQALSAADTVQRYALGARWVTDDGEIFRYAYTATGTINTTGASIAGGVQAEFGAVNPVQSVASAAVLPTQATGAGLALATTLTVTVGATDGVAANGGIAANELIGGWVVVGHGAGQHPQTFRIIGNTVVANGGGVCTLTLDGKILTAVTVGVTTAEVMANPFAHTVSANVANSAYMSVIGMPNVTCVTGSYYWLKRRGIIWITSDNNTGKAANGRDAFFQTNGSIVTASSTTYTCRQRAGYTVDANASGSASNAPFVYLQLE
jgi:hypothetical protein